MKIEKLIHYSIPLYIIAVIARGVEEVSFLYYAVPVLCLAYIIYYLVSVRNESRSVIPNQPVLSEACTEQSRSVEGRNLSLSARFFTRLNRVLNDRAKIVIILILLSGIWFLITALWSPYKERTIERSLYFLLIALGSVCAGLLSTRLKNKVKSKKEETQKPSDFLPFPFLPANIIVVSLCLFSLITGIPSDSWTMGRGYGFGGFFGHQNLLASVLLFTMPGVFAALKVVISDQKSVISKKLNIKHLQLTAYSLKLIAYCLLLTANLLFLTLTYSRSAILALIVGVVLYLILLKKWKTLSFSFLVVFILSLVIYIVPPLKSEANKILKKDFNEIYSSRLLLWEPSFNAALKGGITGLGYGVSDPDFIFPENATGSHYQGEVYEREKGNSVLALIEETGLIGLVLFFLPIIYLLIIRIRGVILNKVRELSPKEETSQLYPVKSFSISQGLLLTSSFSLLTASLIAFITHSQFEAWMVGVGSVQLPLFFVYIGLIFRQTLVSS